MRVYLGGPINGCTDEEANGWRAKAKELLAEAGIEWLDPMTRDYRGLEMEPGIAEKIVEGDKEDMDQCSVLLMNCPKPSVGTSMEVFYGFAERKNVIVVIPDDGSQPSPWLKYHASLLLRGSVLAAIRTHIIPLVS